ncbi:MAG: hypothetical protein RID07_18735, partial [Lacipirellulaceae bacterium]
KRADVARTVSIVTAGDDLATPGVNEFSQTSSENRSTTRRDFTEAAFLGEAGVSASWRINNCVALTSGYQILVLDGVGEALASSFTPGFAGTTQVYHGLQFGLEYRR